VSFVISTLLLPVGGTGKFSKWDVHRQIFHT